MSVKFPIQSNVPGHIGLCKPTWLNKNQVYIRLDGLTGFFRLVRRKWGIWWKYGPEFHGRIDWYKPDPKRDFLHDLNVVTTGKPYNYND